MPIEVRKKENESPSYLINRFTKKMQQSGVLREVKNRRFYKRTVNKSRRRVKALHREEKKKEFEVRIINNPFICHKDLNNLEKVILRKFHGRRLNNAKEELGITKIRYSSMPKKVLDERIQRLKDYVRKNPTVRGHIIKRDTKINFIPLFRKCKSKNKGYVKHT